VVIKAMTACRGKKKKGKLFQVTNWHSLYPRFEGGYKPRAGQSITELQRRKAKLYSRTK
jgi:hypothetical protein